MILFLASLGMGFGAIFAFYFVMWSRAETWPPEGTPELPVALWLSTALIVFSSFTIHAAVGAARDDAQRRLRTLTVLTLLFAIGFVIGQALNWWLAVGAELPPYRNMFAINFYLFTGLHALHVLGGLAPLAVVAVNAQRDRYTPDRHNGLRWTAWYWHFVDVVWLLMFATLLLTS